MRIPRIFQPQALAEGTEIELDTDSVRHAITVLRLREGAELILFNGEGGEYSARLIEVNRNSVRARVEGYDPRESESPLAITLIQGISKGERMDYTLQKAVELGVGRFVPVMTQRTVVNLKGERRDKRQAHWHRVIISACEQCGRNRIPELTPITELRRALESYPGQGLMLDHLADGHIGSIAQGNELSLLIGPEGGLTEGEKDLARAQGFCGVVLGNRVLRTETAALAAIAALQTLFGDFR